MKLAINYSEAAESLLRNNHIRIDLFKCPDWSWLVKKASEMLPVIVHFNLQVGNGNLALTDWEAVDQLYANTHTLYINLHLEPGRKHHPDIPPDSEEPIHQEKIVEFILREIQPLLERYPAEQIIFENSIYRVSGGKVIKPGVLPSVFNTIFNEINCGLLLDISHARISARSLGMDEREYISNLPIHRLKEIHFTGLHQINGKLVDHLPILDQDWPILDWVLAEIKTGKFSQPWLFVYEYGGVGEKYANRCDPEAIAVQVPRLYELVHNILPYTNLIDSLKGKCGE
jgi:uncharacterized protein (UPF0276 family)